MGLFVPDFIDIAFALTIHGVAIFGLPHESKEQDQSNYKSGDQCAESEPRQQIVRSLIGLSVPAPISTIGETPGSAVQTRPPFHTTRPIISTSSRASSMGG